MSLKIQKEFGEKQTVLSHSLNNPLEVGNVSILILDETGFLRTLCLAREHADHLSGVGPWSREDFFERIRRSKSTIRLTFVMGGGSYDLLQKMFTVLLIPANSELSFYSIPPEIGINKEIFLSCPAEQVLSNGEEGIFNQQSQKPPNSGSLSFFAFKISLLESGQFTRFIRVLKRLRKVEGENFISGAIRFVARRAYDLCFRAPKNWSDRLPITIPEHQLYKHFGLKAKLSEEDTIIILKEDFEPVS